MMSVLLVDDDPRKLAVIEAALVKLGVDPGGIIKAEDAAAARRALNSRSFDVLLLDVLLPPRRGALPCGDVSIDLLRQIVEDQTIPIPGQIVGITADEAALLEHGEEFRSLTTQILRIDPAVDAWKFSLKIIVDKGRSAAESPCDYDFDLCVQTALRNPEYQAVVETWPADWSTETQISKGVLFRSGRLQVGDRVMRVGCVHASAMGLVAATDLAGKIIRMMRPRILAMTGICGGVGAGLAIGDLVVAEKAWDWQSGKHCNGEFESAVDQKDASPELVAFARRIEGEIHLLDAGWRGPKPVSRPKLHIAPMVSGSSVVADSAMHDLLQAQHRKVAAVDMEAYGLYFAAQMADAPVPRAVCVKAVSDLANEEKASWAQEYCSYLSAAFVRRLAELAFEASSNP